MASIDIEQIKSALQYGGARPCLFYAQISFDTGAVINSDITSQLYNLEWYCQASSLPKSTIGSVDVSYMGRKIKVAGNRTFSDWTVTVINDEDFALRKAFERWSANINTHIGNTRLTSSAPSSYKANGHIYQLSVTGEKIAHYVFSGIFPTEVGEIKTDWSTENSIETFDVTFACDYWTLTDINTNDNSTGGLYTTSELG